MMEKMIEKFRPVSAILRKNSFVKSRVNREHYNRFSPTIFHYHLRELFNFFGDPDRIIGVSGREHCTNCKAVNSYQGT